MGNCLASVFRRRNVRRHIVLILIGLDNAGKTQTVNNLAGEKDDKVLPTVGFKAVNLVHKDTPVTIYDLGGGPHFRQIWGQYYSEVHGVIFVLDSSDFSRLDECRTVLEEVLSHDKIAGKPVLVLANKQDKSGALDDIDVVDKLNIEPLVNKYRCPTLVESYTAQTQEAKKKPKIDPGLRKGYHWLLNYIIRRYGDINLRVQTDIHAELERRKRMLNKASNTASFSDEIGTQTGFENPTFSVDKSNHDVEKLNKSDGLIIVKPITTSVDSTITIESMESETTLAKPKLSPLFGLTSAVTESVRIELEPKNEFRKLSPIVRNKSGGNQHMDFMIRPQSSPTFKKIKQEPQSHSSTQDEDNLTEHTEPTYTDVRNYTWDGHMSPKHRVRLDDADVIHREILLTERGHNQTKDSESTYTDVRNYTWDGHMSPKHRVRLDDADVIHREILLTERDYTNKSAYSEVGVSRATLPAVLSPRPASASQLVRRQLELASTHKRRLSLRYMHRNKTSPARASMLVYEPSKAQRLDKGDFEHAPVLN